MDQFDRALITRMFPVHETDTRPRLAEKDVMSRKTTRWIAHAVGILLACAGMLGHAESKLYFVHPDHLGTPQVMTDQSGQMVWQADYRPFGEIELESGAASQKMRLPGQYADGESGLYYNYYRDYDPTIGRYIQSDPIGLRGGINTYGYVLQNPLRYTDPSGQNVAVGIGVGLAILYVATSVAVNSGNQAAQGWNGSDGLGGLDVPGGLLPDRIDPWKDTTTRTEVPSNALPPSPADNCMKDFENARKNCEAQCSNGLTKSACMASARIKYWICAARRPRTDWDDFSDLGGGDGPGFSGGF